MLSIEYLAELARAHQTAAKAKVPGFSLGGHTFTPEIPAIMGVINLSPDSWYRESVCLSPDSAIERGKVLLAQGADLVDVGAESTLSHAQRVEADAQTNRLLPVITGLTEAGGIVSVETYNVRVADTCLQAGAKVLNLTGTEGTTEMYSLAAEHQAAVIICYVQGKNVREVADFNFAADPIDAMYDYFARQLDLAHHAGLERVWIDPGMGFYYRNLQDSAIRVRHQMRVFLNSYRLRALGAPVCHALPHAFEFFGAEVRSAEAFFAVLASLGCTHLFRTHEVPRVRAVLRTLQAF